MANKEEEIEDVKFGRRPFSEVLKKSYTYIDKRRLGIIKSLKTPWASFNEAGVDGLEWGSMLTIGARPGAGKTMIVSQILREARLLNPTQDFNILEFQFEMGDEQYGARQFAGHMAMDYGHILSTKKQLDEFTMTQLKNYIADCEALEKVGIRRELISKSITSVEMEKAILNAYVEWGAKPMIITIDHSWLIKKKSDEKEKLQTLYNTTEMIMQLKNKIPIVVLMITQLNRSIDESSRKEPGKIGNYPTAADIFGGDALMQGSDMIAILNRPFKSNIPVYGPKLYAAEIDDVFMHLIKIRNGNDSDENIVFLKMDGKRQRMAEVSAPPSKKGTMSMQLPSQQNGGWSAKPSKSSISADIGDEL